MKKKLNRKERKEEMTNHEGTKFTKFKRVNIRTLRALRASLKIRGVKMGFRIVAWMERSGIQEGDMGRGGGNGVRE